VAVFVDGCFWHSCPIHATTPRNNAIWWQEKLATNVTRDRDTDAYLHRQGWLVCRFWEHDDVQRAAELIANHVSRRALTRAKNAE